VRPGRGVSRLEEESLIEPVVFTCQFCSERQEWDTREAADAAAVLAPVWGSSAALARDRRGPLPHGSSADAAGAPADTHRIRLSKERRRPAQVAPIPRR